MARLIMRRGPTIGAIYELNDDVITIGRGNKCDIIIRDNEISREHCRLIRIMDDYELEDMASSNGTFVNGQRVLRNWLLQQGAIVELGDSITLEYAIAETAAPPAPAPAPAAPALAPLVRVQYGLMMTLGPDIGRTYDLHTSTVKVGRDLSNDIVIQDPEVSRFHLRLTRLPQGYQVEDLNSTNGTVVNTTAVSESIHISEGDVIKLGTGVHLQFINQGQIEISDEHPTIMRRIEVDLSTHTMETSPPVFAGAGPTNMQKTNRLGTGLDPGALESYIFIAYDRQDWEQLVVPLTLSLQDAGLNIWVDQYLRQGEPDWRAAVEQALHECWLMIPILTSRSVTAGNVKMQYRYFLNRDKPLIPLIYQPVATMPVEFGKKRAIIHDTQNPHRSVQKLIYEIKELRKQLKQ